MSHTRRGAPIISASAPALYFPEPRDHGVENRVTLRAVEEDAVVVFGVKSTTPARYVVKPRYGVIRGGAAAEVSVVFRAVEEEADDAPGLSDKFRVEARVVDPGAHAAELEQLLHSPHAANSKEEQEQVKALLKRCDAARASSITLPCHFRDVAIPSGAVVRPLHHNSTAGAPRAAAAGSTAPESGPSRSPPPPPRQHAESLPGGGGGGGVGGAGAAPVGAQLAEAVAAKRAERDELRERLARLDEQLARARRENEEVVAAAGKTAALLQRHRALQRQRGGPARRVIAATATRMIPTSVTIMAIMLTFIVTLWLRGAIRTTTTTP